MTSFNKIQIVGYLGRKPDLRYTASGTAVAGFSIATSQRRRSRDGVAPAEITTWFRVTLWGRQAEAAASCLDKGSLAYVEGRLTTRAWTDRDGCARTSLEVSGTDVRFIDSRRPGAESAAASPRRSSSIETDLPDDGEIDDSDLPY
jgi:single-strand DNA-binding protein